MPTDTHATVQALAAAAQALGDQLPGWPAGTRPQAEAAHVALTSFLEKGAQVLPAQLRPLVQQLRVLDWPDPAAGAHLVQLLEEASR